MATERRGMKRSEIEPKNTDEEIHSSVAIISNGQSSKIEII